MGGHSVSIGMWLRLSLLLPIHEVPAIAAARDERCFGAKLADTSLVPLGAAMQETVRFGEWVR